MKTIFALFFAVCFLAFAGCGEAVAQHRNLTVVLLRHAEKDMSPNADKVNPELSAEGRLRAQKLVKAVNKYKPDAIYSSDFIRTRATAAPLAEKRRLAVQVYDHRNLIELKNLILSGKIKRLVIVGHNTTTPQLVNMLLGEQKYQPLAESEYDKIFVVKIKKRENKPNKVSEKVITY